MTAARRLWLTLHTYLGLSIGLVWVLLGLTGSILVFYLQLDLWLNPEIDTQSSSTVNEQQAVLNVLHEHFPERLGSWRIEQPLHDGWPIMVRYYTPIESKNKLFAPLMVTLDPETLRVTSDRFWGEFAMTWIYNLHFTLLLDKTGLTIIGIFGLVSLISLISGLMIWWPGWRRLGKALRLQLRQGVAKKVFDIHALSGSYGLVVLLMLSLTGAALALPDETRIFIKPFSSIYKSPDVFMHTPASNNQTNLLDADDAVRMALKQFPEAELRWVESPGKYKNSWRIILYQQGEPSRRFPRTQVWINAQSKQIMAVRDGLNETAGDTLLNWLHPLHNGEVFGLPGRIIVFITGLLPLILFITGVMRCQQKRRAKQRSALRHLS
ncbi:hypothetical protein LCGC14_0522070 [marine sediment metagenome]|uniref:PepSY domain-containing protein n=1 Tax=marine sediment metagenome TaxID=412755 RepID=A0A0F9RY62_9ZZZZ